MSQLTPAMKALFFHHPLPAATRWSAKILLLVWLAWSAAAGTVSAQSSGFRPPPEPRVKPQIPRHFPEDADGNRIDDALDLKAGAARPEAATNLVEVRLLFSKQVTQGQLDAFTALGGQIGYVFQTVSYGWNGRIPLNRVRRLPAVLGDGFLQVREPKPIKAQLLNATLQGRVRTVWTAGYFGYVPGFSGSNDTSIGIVDSGVDSTHTDLTNRCLYWKDQTPDNFSTNKDIVQHGTHVTGIACGTGAASGSAAGPLSFTLIGTFGANAGDGVKYIEPITFLATNSVTWSATAKWDGGGATSVELDSAVAGKNSFGTIAQTVYYSPAGYTNTFNPTLTNIYLAAVESGVSGAQVTNYVVTNHLSYYPSAGDGFNRLRGVASGCNYVAEKVFTNNGTGLDSWVEAGIDDLTAKRTNYNVKVMNLSLSGSADATLRADVNTAVNNGIVVVAAAGNNGESAGAISDPGSAAMAITVAGANSQIALTSYSSLGFTNPVSAAGEEQDYKPDLMAPGGSQYYGGILSADSNSGDGTAFSDQVPNDYTALFGTSMASPFVAGTAALVIQAMEANGCTWDFNSSTDASLVKMLICATATESDTNRETGTNNPTLQRAAAGPNGYPVGKDPDEGYGMINADAAVQAVQQSLFSGFTTNYSLGGSNTAARAWAGHFADGGRPVYATLTVPAGGDFDLYLYSGSSGTYGAPVILASSTQAGNGTSETFLYRPAAAGTNYLVVKDIAGSGAFTLVISNFNNDNFTNAFSLSGLSGSTVGTNRGFTTESGETVPAGGSASAWYSWTAPYAGQAAFIVSNGIPTVYTGSGVSSLTKLAGQGTTATNTVTVAAGTTYYLQVCATNSAGTNYLLAWSLLAPSVSLTNATAISLTANSDGSASSPYPSATTVSGLVGTIQLATVTLVDYTMQGAIFCDSLLVSPASNNIALMIHNGDTSSFTNLTLTFADDGVYPPGASVLTNGTYQCTCPALFFSMSSPAPARPYSTNLSDLIGQSPDGTWNLYAQPNTSSTLNGSISNWCLNLSLDVPPALTTSASVLNYTNGTSGSNLTATVTLSSLYYPNLSGGSLTAAFLTNAAAADILALPGQGTGVGQIGVSGGAVSYGGTNLGTLTGGGNGTTPLVISFTNTSATLAVVRQIITNLVFSTASTATNTRQVELTLADPNGGSVSATQSVTVTIGNIAPVVANPIPNQSATYGASFSYTFSANTFTDSNAGQTLAFAASGPGVGAATGIAFNSATRTFSATTVDSGSGGTIAGAQSIAVVATDNGTPPLSVTNSFTLTIAKAVASITPAAAARSYGATNPAFGGSLSGFVAADAITANYASSATTNSVPGGYAIAATLTDSHGDAGNYTITTNSANLTVTDAPVTITAVGVSRSYGATNPVFTVTYAGLTNGQTFASSGITGTPALVSAATTNSAPGGYVITNSLGTLASSDYSFTFANGTLTVTQAVLTVTATNVTRAYGATNPVFLVSFTGFTNGQTLAGSGVTGASALTTAAGTNSAPGTYVITNAAGTLAAADYSFNLVNGSLTVTQAVLTVAASPATRGYGGTNPVFAVTYAGFTNGQTLAGSGVTGAPALTTAATTNSVPGAYVITNAAGTLAGANYSFALGNSTLTVTQALLTVTATGVSRVYGGTNPVFTVTYVGFTNGQTLANSGVTGSPALASSALTNSSVGAYVITNGPGTLAAADYGFSLVNGTLTVTQAQLAVTAGNFARAYGATNPVFTGTLTGVTAGDVITAAYNCAATTNSAPGAYSIVPALADPGSRLGNYTVTTNAGTLTVSTVPLLVAANPASRAYGVTNPAFTASYTGFVNGQTIDSGTVTGAPALTTAAATNSTVGLYAITNAAGTLASADYYFTFSNSVLTVTPTALTVSPASAARAYGRTNPVLAGTLAGLVNADAITATFTTTAGTGSPVGAYPISVTLSDPDSRLPNYSVTTNTASLTVTNACGSNNYTATLLVSNSLVQLATNGTMDFTFTDPASGLGVVIAVSLAPYSSSNASPAFTLLDTYGPGGSPVHLGIDSGLGGGDGNWVDYFEGENFAASLVSVSTGILTNSVQFGISGLGIRPSGGTLSWTSSATTNVFSPSAEALMPLDLALAPLNPAVYAGELRCQSADGQYQLSDFLPPSYDGIVMSASFFEGTNQPVTAGPPAFAAFGITNNWFQFTVTGTAGASYILQAATNLAAPVWVGVATNAVPFIFTDSNAGTAQQKFYRAVSVP